MGLYHERQYKNYCRCHAINNLLGYKLIDTTEFDNLCDDFDRKNSFENGCSKKDFTFYNYGGNNNIFGYIFERKNIDVVMHHYNFYSNKKQIGNRTKKTIGYIIYNLSHTYCIKIDNLKNKMYLIDSLKSNINEINDKLFLNRRNLGVIEINEK